MEGDNIAKFDGSFYTAISIHALRVEGDSKLRKTVYQHDVFLSTPSGWRATLQKSRQKQNIFISIHALRVEGDRTKEGQDVESFRISIHALRVEGDRQIGVDVEKWTAISIHALRVEGDVCR